MSTAGWLIAALSEMPKDEEIYYVFWTRSDINELLEEDDESPVSDEEWALFHKRLVSDESLSHAIWETVQDYVIKLTEERHAS